MQITRRGKPLARVLRAEGGLGEALAEWRRSAEPEAFVGGEWADGLRDRRDRGRKVDL